MKYYIKQHVFSWGDKFTVFDSSGNECLYIEGELFSFTKKLHIFDAYGNEVAFVRSVPFTFIPRYVIELRGRAVAEVIKDFTFFRQQFTVAGPEWLVCGDFFDHTYEISYGDTLIASVQKEWFTFGDAYAIDVRDNKDDMLALAIVIVIDAEIARQNN